MQAHDHSQIAEVLGFWFGPLDGRGLAGDAARRRWFQKDADFDHEIETRFGALRQGIIAREREHWRCEPRSLLAYVIVLDQFSRNLGRGTPVMFETDAQAVEAALEGIARGDDTELGFSERVFLYMPLMHDERLAMQERCVELFSRFCDALGAEARALGLDANLRFAIQHRDIVARFGRFPHRNAILGRPSTPEEEAFLQQPGSSF
ncbi:MAG: DUF924 domain-containing protein [Myxococcales bacterium]|nr:DUF924 domain-containing protein [Myxococcales bacterium]